MRGKMHAFGEFRDVLAREMATALPELRPDVERVVRETGGRPLPEVNGAGAAAAASSSTGVPGNGTR